MCQGIEKKSTDPLGKKRTSKHQKKHTVRVEISSADPRRTISQFGPRPNQRDIPVGGVDAVDLGHGRDMEEERKERTRAPGVIRWG